jgi:hypothetical protein
VATEAGPATRAVSQDWVRRIAETFSLSGPEAEARSVQAAGNPANYDASLASIEPMARVRGEPRPSAIRE